MRRIWSGLPFHSKTFLYGSAVLLAIAAQVGRLVLHPPTIVPFITYAPFVVVSALLGGIGPGILTTILCTLEIAYFALEPIGSFSVKDPTNWHGIGAFVVTGLAASILAEWLDRSRDQLLEAHNRTAMLLESLSDGFTALDREHRHTYVNAAAAKMLGKTPAQVLGKSLQEVWPHAEDSPLGAACRRAILENIPVQVEVSYPEPLNAWFEVRCYPSEEGLSLFFSDKTERKRAEEESQLLRSIVESSDDAIISKNLNGIILSWNQGAERIYGYTSQEIVGRHISVLIPPDHSFEAPELIDNLRRGGRIEHYETERRTKQGRCIFVSLTLSPIKNPAGCIIGASVIARDITERKRAETALALSEERYRSLTLATSQIVWTMDREGEMLEHLPMWSEFTGQSPAEVRGWGWLNALHPDDRERTAAIWSASLQNRSRFKTEFRLSRRDGQYRYMSVCGVAVLEQDGTTREWVGICADITEHVLAEEEVRKLNESLEKRVVERTAELQAANKELEAFAYSVSHDLRAPLRAIDGFSRILLEEYARELPAEAHRYLEFARNNAIQMGNLIDGLLDFSRLGRQPLRRQTVSPAAVVRRALEDLRVQYEGRQVEIIVGHLPDCEGDPLLLKQLFVNLLSNAFKYTRGRDHARIEIASREPHAYYVRDNGVGFDMRYQDKLFGVFQRLHNSEEYEGTGVGLAIVQRIVHRHGGRVWAEAVVNQGATFYFTLGQGRETDRKLPEGVSPLKVAEELTT